MPFEVIDNTDPLTQMISFRPSEIFELLLSARNLFMPARFGEVFATRAREALDAQLWTELEWLFTRFNDGAYYFELPIGYGKDDVPGFLEYLRTLPTREFVFLALGRLLLPEQVTTLLKGRRPVEAFRSAIDALPEKYKWYQIALDTLITDPDSLKARLYAALSAYWTQFFQHEVASLRPIWSNAIAEQSAALDRDGGRELFEKITGHNALPPELPEDVPYQQIVLTPCVFLPSRVYQLFGYGNVTILFNPQNNDQTRTAAENARRSAMATLRALDDDTRLKILQMIVQSGHRVHGKSIAEKLNISASAVSRHLALLKEGGLISEVPQKNLIMYRFHREAITRLPEDLLDYLYN